MKLPPGSPHFYQKTLQKDAFSHSPGSLGYSTMAHAQGLASHNPRCHTAAGKDRRRLFPYALQRAMRVSGATTAHVSGGTHGHAALHHPTAAPSGVAHAAQLNLLSHLLHCCQKLSSKPSPPGLPPCSRGCQITPAQEHATPAFRPRGDKQALGHFAVSLLALPHQLWQAQTLLRATTVQDSEPTGVYSRGHFTGMRVTSSASRQRADCWCSCRKAREAANPSLQASCKTCRCSKLPTHKWMALPGPDPRTPH